MTTALAILLSVAGSSSPRVHRLARDLAPVLAICAAATGRDARELAKIAWVESSYRRNVVGRKGERGPWQILPSTGRTLCHDLRWRTSALDNCRCAAIVLDSCEKQGRDLRACYTGRRR